MEKLSGIRSVDMVGKGEYEYALPWYQERRPILIDLVLSNGQDTFSKYPSIKRDGDHLSAEITLPHFYDGAGASFWFTASPLYDNQGTVVGAIESIREITESKRVEEELRLDESRLGALLTLSHMIGASLHDITHFALEAAVRLTGSTIGYIAFVNEDESVLTMHAWSQSAMDECQIREKPLIYPIESTGLWGEAVRQRVPVITNDYTADNSQKKGTPKGHVQLLRHLSVPVFDEDRIVVVVVVGNKNGNYGSSDVRQLELLMSGMWTIISRKKAEKSLLRNNEELHAAYEEISATEEELRSNLEELTRQELELRDSERELSDIINFLPDATLVINLEGTVVAWNRAIEAMTGIPSDLMIGKGNYEYALPFYHERRKIMVDLNLHEDPAVAKKYPVITRKGKYLFSEIFIPHLHNGRGAYLWITACPLYDTAGDLKGAIESIRDITERKKVEETLAESERKYRQVVEDQTEMICRFLPDGTHVFVNEAYCRYFNLRREELIGHRFTPNIHPEDRNIVSWHISSLTPERPVAYIDQRLIMPDGLVRWQRWSDRAIFDLNGILME